MIAYLRTRSPALVVLLMLGAGLAAASPGQLGSRPAGDWIALMERPERIVSLKVDHIVDALDLRPGLTVADVGAGAGAFSLALAQAVGVGGTVYAEDVDPAFVTRIEQKAAGAGAANVRAVLGTYADPQLPARDVDLGFMHDVLHHIENPAGYLKTLAGYLKPGGRLAIVEYDGPRGPHRSNPALQVTREQLDAWMAAAGFVPDTVVDGLFGPADPRWFVIYRRQP
ncbi:MAG: methyltransferase domain-containing protein [Acidobacteriota bacterium]